MGLRADFAQYAEVVTLSRLQSGLSEEAEKVVNRGQSIMSIFRQGQYAPVSIPEQVLLLYALSEGVLYDMSERQRAAFCAQIGSHVRDPLVRGGLWGSSPSRSIVKHTYRRPSGRRTQLRITNYKLRITKKRSSCRCERVYREAFSEARTRRRV